MSSQYILVMLQKEVGINDVDVCDLAVVVRSELEDVFSTMLDVKIEVVVVHQFVVQKGCKVHARNVGTILCGKILPFCFWTFLSTIML